MREADEGERLKRVGMANRNGAVCGVDACQSPSRQQEGLPEACAPRGTSLWPKAGHCLVVVTGWGGGNKKADRSFSLRRIRHLVF